VAADDLIIVVDEHDRPIGTKPRNVITTRDIYRVAALWLTNSAGEVLIAQRSLNRAKSPGLWGPAAAGTIDAGETYESNIYKEAQEEIGLTGIKFELGPKRFVDEPDRSRHFTQWFIGQVDWPLSRFRLQADEVARIAWVPPDQLAADIASHPQKYVASGPDWAQMFPSRL
jgi:8-oxo-dGTP pyrophosphatase MutT (NUDIX family)